MSGAKYEVMSQTVEILLSPGTAQFKVPVFQRKYAWGMEEIGRLVDDLYGESANADLPYFLGSIVLARQEGDDAAPDLVLDGQQRLTTLSLMISILIHKMREEGVSDADENKTYLFSRRLKGKKTPKVILQQDDAKIFEGLLNSPERALEQQFKRTTLGEATMKLYALLDEFALRPQYRESGKPYEAMLERLLYDVELVRITAPSERDAFRLFETLNDRGLALSAADLIKNKLFSQCKDELDDAVDCWGSVLLLTKDDDVVNFLRSYWIAFRGFVRKRGLYDAYKKHIEVLGATEATLFAIELEEAAKLYGEIVAPNPTSRTWGPDVVFGLDRLANSYHARICRPALLAFAKARPTELVRAIQLCESITVRYQIVGDKNPNRLEWLYADICAMLREEDDPWTLLHESSIINEVPEDEEFRTKLGTMEIPVITPGWREVLVRLNREIGGGEARLDGPSRVHVEHVLPQSPRATALTEAGMSQEQAMRFVGRLGNLTLLSGRRNQQLSNRPFSEKRETYAVSDVFITRELSSAKRWTGEEIEQRSLKFADVAVSLFPHPKRIATDARKAQSAR